MNKANHVPKLGYHSLLRDYQEFACGWGAQMINISLTYPVNKLIFRQMLLGISVRKAFLQMMDEGIVSLYRGMLPPLLQKSVSSSLMFGTYDMFKKRLSETNSLHPILSTSVAAVLAGSVEAILTPFERVQTLLQDSAYQKDFVNMKHVVKVIQMEYGFTEYYRGLAPVLWRNAPSNVVFFLLREELSDKVPHAATNIWGLEMMKHFLIGACIGAINSTIFYPFNVIKVHVQSRLGGSFQSMWQATREIYTERGRKVGNFYKGVHMNYTRSFISWGVINLAYEQLKVMYTDDEVLTK